MGWTYGWDEEEMWVGRSLDIHSEDWKGEEKKKYEY